jgi:hypothetical protein
MASVLPPYFASRGLRRLREKWDELAVQVTAHSLAQPMRIPTRSRLYIRPVLFKSGLGSLVALGQSLPAHHLYVRKVLARTSVIVTGIVLDYRA